MTVSAIARRKLGSTGPEVFPLALGCMGMSGIYGPTDDAESIAAIDAGVTILDTGDFYGMGHNEMLLGRALRFQRDQVMLSVKFGAQRAPSGAWLGFDARPAAVKTALSYSLQRLGVDYVDIYRPARLDAVVPIEETVGAVGEMVQAGYVRHIGLSEVGAETIQRAAAVHPIVDVQIEYALISRGPEAKIFPLLEKLGIAATTYGTLSRGLLTQSPMQAKGDYRTMLPRFTGDNQARNRQLSEKLKEIAASRNVSPAQLAIAWALHKQPFVIPVIGARTRAQLAESLGALEVHLSGEEMAALESAIPADAVAGTRYGADQMKHLDSEK